MKIRFLTSIADVTGWSYDYGEIAEVPDERALQFIKHGHAEAVRDTSDEAAVLAGAKLREGLSGMPVAPQANALLVVDDVRGPLGITSTAQADIDMMQELINSASDVIEAHCHRKLKQRAFTALRLPRQSSPRLRPPATPINVAQTVTLSHDDVALTVWRTEADGTRTERDVVIGSDEAGAPSYFRRTAGWWSSDDEPILLSYTGGFDPIPGGLKQSAILTVQAFHRQEQNLEPYQSYPASATGGTVVMRTDTIPRTAMMLLEPYCFVDVA